MYYRRLLIVLIFLVLGPMAPFACSSTYVITETMCSGSAGLLVVEMTAGENLKIYEANEDGEAQSELADIQDNQIVVAYHSVSTLRAPVASEIGFQPHITLFWVQGGEDVAFQFVVDVLRHSCL